MRRDMRERHRTRLLRTTEPTATAFTNSPEYALCAAIMVTAVQDLRSSDPQVQGEVRRWFAAGDCAWLCEVLGMPLDTVQAKARHILAQPHR